MEAGTAKATDVIRDISSSASRTLETLPTLTSRPIQQVVGEACPSAQVSVTPALLMPFGAQRRSTAKPGHYAHRHARYGEMPWVEPHQL